MRRRRPLVTWAGGLRAFTLVAPPIAGSALFPPLVATAPFSLPKPRDLTIRDPVPGKPWSNIVTSGDGGKGGEKGQGDKPSSDKPRIRVIVTPEGKIKSPPRGPTTAQRGDPAQERARAAGQMDKEQSTKPRPSLTDGLLKLLGQFFPPQM